MTDRFAWLMGGIFVGTIVLSIFWFILAITKGRDVEE